MSCGDGNKLFLMQHSGGLTTKFAFCVAAYAIFKASEEIVSSVIPFKAPFCNDYLLLSNPGE